MKQTLLNYRVAVTGMSCRFPQAETPEAFWRILSEGIQTVSELSDKRWHIDHYYDADKSAEGKTNQKHGSLLENPDDFDPLFFNISPSEAMEMSPSQKLMLELAWEAMEYSSTPLSKWMGSETGVYVGNIWNDFEHMRKHKNAPVRQHSAMGQSTNLIANRVSYTFGFTGPSLVMDTGCSSSLVALHLGLQALMDGSIRQAMIGGINHTLDIDQSVLLSKFGGLSSKGKCSTFDAEGDGFVRGEGAGMIVMKRLEDAERDGDNILAVICGSAMNNNGFNESLPATSTAGQIDVLTRAYAHSGIKPEDVHYIEAHGTGTKLGDPTECRALGTFFGNENRRTALRLGSVKTNVGHTEAAAGMAGLIKVLLAMKHRSLPASLNYNTPNPAIDFDTLKLQVQDTLGSWPAQPGEPLRAGVNSFGWGGTNAHVVLEEYIPAEKRDKPAPKEQTMYMLPLYARSASALKELALSYQQHLQTRINGKVEDLASVCQDTALRSLPMPYRLTLFGKDKPSLMAHTQEMLEQVAQTEPSLAGPHKTVFIFPGQGSQWAGMGAELYKTEPVFRQAIDQLETAFAPFVSWSLKDVLFATAEEDKLSSIDVIQPALCAVMIALARLWQSRGVQADAVVGHSMGEVAAAYIAGALSIDDAARVICTRSQLMSTLAGQGGAMAVTELTIEEAREVCGRFDGRLSVAVNNSLKSTVLAGNSDDIEVVLTELESQGLFCRRVKVDVASHSPQMDAITGALGTALAPLTPQAANTPIYSTVEARQMSGTDLDSAYWVSNLRGTVRYAEIIKTLIGEGYTTFIEVSPHPVLSTPTQETAAGEDVQIISVPTLLRNKEEAATFYSQMAALTEKGFDPDWQAYYQTDTPAGVRLPSYPFQRETYALEDRSAEKNQRDTQGRHPFLGKPLTLPGMENTYYFEGAISLAAFPYLRDHSINGEAVLPGAAFADMALTAASEVYDGQALAIRDLYFEQALYLTDDQAAKIHLRIVGSGWEKAAFTFYKETGQAQSPYKVLCQGELLIGDTEGVEAPAYMQQEWNAVDHTATLYADLTAVGLEYGEHFRGLSGVSSPVNGQAMAWLSLTDTVEKSLGKYTLHPALLDSCFQAVFSRLDTTGKNKEECSAYLTGIENLRLYRQAGEGENLKLLIHSLRVEKPSPVKEVFSVDITLYADEEAVFTASGIQGTVMNSRALHVAGHDSLYERTWQEMPIPQSSNCMESRSFLLFGEEGGFCTDLKQALEACGATVTLMVPGTPLPNSAFFSPADEAHYRLAIEAGEWHGVIHAALYEEEQAAAGFAAGLPAMSAVYAGRTLSSLQPGTPYYILTRGLWPLKGNGPVSLQEASIGGVARVMMNELPELHTTHIDLSMRPGQSEMAACLTLLVSPVSGENEIGLRGQVAYVPRLQPMEAPASGRTVSYDPEGTYLVSGFRGLGFSFIEYMIRQGAKQLLLISRSGTGSEEVMDKIAAYRQQGMRIDILRADVSQYESLVQAVEEALSDMPPLKGIVHAAGLINPTAVTELDLAEFNRIMSPKAVGAWNLHELSKQHPVEHFIMFSSASVFAGLSGQASYVAANAYLDSLADYRRAEGLPATSVQWGVIQDVGMVADHSHLQRFAEAEGFVFIKGSEAMDVFEQTYHSGISKLGICRIDGRTMAEHYPRLAQTPYFAALLPADEDGGEEDRNLLATVATCADPAEAKAMLLEHIKGAVARIIKSSPDKLDRAMTFPVLGIDSLMTIQLRNKLEQSIGIKISVAAFRQHSSLGDFAGFLYKEIQSQEVMESQDTSVSHHRYLLGNADATATHRLICFHDAGGDASLYHEWTERLHGTLEVFVAELPGRDGSVLPESMIQMAENIAEEIKALPYKPYILFGQSMGGALLFEVMRALQAKGVSIPEHVMVSSVPMLDAYDRSIVDYRMSDEQLIGFYPQFHLQNLGGDSELQKRLMQTIRHDMQVLTEYQYTPQQAWPTHITAICASEDNIVTREQVSRWQAMTSRDFTLMVRPGGHRYLTEDATFLTDYIMEVIQGRQVQVIR